jgi:cell division protein ZipA
MAIAAVIIFVFALIGALMFVRRIKNQDTPTNRYRHYQAKSTSKSAKVKPNRYRQTSRREPELGYEHAPGVDEPSPATHAERPVVDVLAVESDDSDVVLGLRESPALNREKPIPTEAQITLTPPPPPPPLITFNIVADEPRSYMGYELLQAMLSAGMRYGQHNIFHRHEQKTGRGALLFSLASICKPGTFDLSKMGGFSTPGLSLFFTADKMNDPVAVYELMLKTAGQLVEDLGGHVLDEHKQLLTPATVVKQRQLLHQYLAAKQVPDLFEETVS